VTNTSPKVGFLEKQIIRQIDRRCSMEIDKLHELEKELKVARSQFNNWKAQAETREDGSQAQDSRFEERGQRLNNLIDELTRKVLALKDSVSGAKAQQEPQTLN